MKSMLLALALFVSFNVQAQEKLPANVLAEMAMQVGFAPPENVGTYRFQVLSTGVLQRVDNKDVVTALGTISLNEATKIQSRIDRIKSTELKKENGPECMDAPYENMTVQTTDGTNLVIWEQVNCNENKPKDRNAKAVSKLIHKLRNETSGN